MFAFRVGLASASYLAEWAFSVGYVSFIIIL